MPCWPSTPPALVFSWRHVPSWLILAGSAGAVNAAAFLACQRFVTHVTGTVTRFGLDWGSALALEYGVVLGCFILGAAASVLAIDARHYRGKEPLHAVPLLMVSSVLALVAGLGYVGAFGDFGTAVETAGDFGLLSLLAFAMGLQNAAVATSTGMFVRTTHLTGPATDLGVGLAMSLFVVGEQRKNALRAAALRGGKIVSFAVGAGLTLPLCARAQYLAFLVPAAGVLTATLLSFRPQRAEGGIETAKAIDASKGSAQTAPADA